MARRSGQLQEADLAGSSELQGTCLWGIGLNHAGFLDVDVYGGLLWAGFRLCARMSEVEVAG
jgi:hypothetical protein